jgi:hypothetical protein
MRNTERKTQAFMLLILAIEDALIRRLKSHILGNFPLGQTEARDELPITPFCEHKGMALSQGD